MTDSPRPRWFLALWAPLLLACPGGGGEQASAPHAVWPAADLVAVEVIDPDRVIVVAATGEIHITADSGLSWRRAHVPAVAGLRSISMADPDAGWAVGDGVILRTDEGGLSWRRQRLPRPADQVRLTSVSAIDREHAIAVGENGIRLRTQDGGRIWQDVSPSPLETLQSSVSDAGVFCAPESSHRCWSVVGRTIRSTNDAGQTWRGVEVEDFERLDPIGFGIGQVEVSDAETDRFEDFISANRHRSQLKWRIEPGIAARELERIGRRRDPDALFELIDARLQEIRSMLEVAGVPANRIMEIGGPPWDYEDYLDDDSDVLDRYWAARRASTPSVRIRIVDESKLFSLCTGARGLGLAVGAAGTLLRSDDAGEHWVMAEQLSPHDLFDVGIGRGGAVVVGAQGGLWFSMDDGHRWVTPTGHAYAPFFDALRAISFSPAGDFGMIVGERGRMLRSRDGGVEWELVVRDG